MELAFKDSDKVEGMGKDQLRTLLSLATKESLILFNGSYYKQIDGVAMGSPLGPTFANIFLCYYEENWLSRCPADFRPSFYRRYVDDIFLLFSHQDHLARFKDYMNSCHQNMSLPQSWKMMMCLLFLTSK